MTAQAGLGLLPAFGAALCVLIGGEIVRCDLLWRLIPRELCGVLAFGGAVFQGSCFGVSALPACGAAMLFVGVVGAVTLAIAAARGLTAGSVLGGGDIRCAFALAIATGHGATVGVAACGVSAAAFCLFRFAVRSPQRRDPFPFAPFLVLWLVVGMARCLA